MVIRRLYNRDHLDQVLATFALILILSEGTRWLFGSFPLYLERPSWLAVIALVQWWFSAEGRRTSVSGGPPVHVHIAPYLRAPGTARYVAAAELGAGIYFDPVDPASAAGDLRSMAGSTP